MSAPLRLLIDAVKCPVKPEIYRLAQRHGIAVVLVTANDMGAPFEPWLTKVVAGAAVHDAIDAEAGPRDVVVTDDEALALKLLAKKISVLTTRGQRWTADEGPQPFLMPKSPGHYRSRFETVLDDELRERLRSGL